MKRFLTILAASIVGTFACVSEHLGRTKLADGSYELKCKKPLGECLRELADVCREQGYDVVRGKEEKRRFGVEPMQTEVITSNATIRCRSATPLLSLDEKTAPVGVAARCFPGSTQACLGPAACKGAQTCRNDGAGFGVCDCGAPSPERVPDATEANDAGPPPTWAVPPSDGSAPPQP